MIRATEKHEVLYGDAALVCSIDLAILGAEPRRYGRYEAAVRREYGYVPEEVYREGRRRFVRALLERPAIYANLDFARPARRRGAAQPARRGLLRLELA